MILTFSWLAVSGATTKILSEINGPFSGLLSAAEALSRAAKSSIQRAHDASEGAPACTNARQPEFTE